MALEVMHVPELKVNLLSVSTLEDEGYEVVFQDRTILMVKGNRDPGCSSLALGRV